MISVEYLKLQCILRAGRKIDVVGERFIKARETQSLPDPGSYLPPRIISNNKLLSFDIRSSHHLRSFRNNTTV